LNKEIALQNALIQSQHTMYPSLNEAMQNKDDKVLFFSEKNSSL